MSRYFARLNTVLTNALIFTREVESADPVNLTSRVNAALAEIFAAAGAGSNLLVCNLAGSGDGPSYRVQLIGCNTATPVDYLSIAVAGTPPVATPMPVPLTNLRAACYKAASAGPQTTQPNNQLLLQRQRVVTALAVPLLIDPNPVWDEMQAGSSDGLSVMGLILYSASPIIP